MMALVPQANVRAAGAIGSGNSLEQNVQKAKAIVDQNFGASREQVVSLLAQNAPNIDRATREVKTDRELLNALDRVRAYRDSEMNRFVAWLQKNTEALGARLGEVRVYGEARIRNEEDLQRKVAIHMAWQRQRAAAK